VYSWRVPLTASGPLRLVAIHDLGALGPGEGEPVLMDWHWYCGLYRVAGWTLWAILLAAMAAPRANRTREVLLILVPVLFVYVAWPIGAFVLEVSASNREVFRMMALSLAVGSAALWLVGHVLARCTKWTALVLALGLGLSIALVGVLSVFDFSARTISLALMLGFLVPAMILAYPLAGRKARNNYSPTRLILLLAGATAAVSAAGMPLWYLTGTAASGNWPRNFLAMLAVTPFIGLVLGACISLITVAFVLVGLRSPLFRPRLFACLRLPSIPRPADMMAATQPPPGE
jgi:hypothetical protein